MADEVEVKIPKRGGARKGAGRKKAEGVRHMYTIPDDVAQWIKEHGGGPYIAEVIRELMKKSLCFLLFFICTLSMSAQDRHMKFLGIPLDGTIEQFQRALFLKGYKPDKLNKITPIGTRLFDGTFMDDDALIIVYYDTKTKVVHSAKAVFTRLSQDNANKKIGKVMDLLYEKYNTAKFHEKHADYLKHFYVEDFPDFDGQISIYQTKVDDLSIYPYEYSLHIEYIDLENYEKNKQSEMEDL